MSLAKPSETPPCGSETPPAFSSRLAHVSFPTLDRAQLADDFGLQVQTGGIACNYFDRYIHIALRKGPISKRQMQMIASTCLLIAAKFFDRKLPPLSELAIVHNHAVSVEQFMHQEMVILEALEWKLHVILPHALIEPLKTCLPDAPFDLERMMFFIDLSVYGTRRTVGARVPLPSLRAPPPPNFSRHGAEKKSTPLTPLGSALVSAHPWWRRS
jgi:hypothetical protein